MKTTNGDALESALNNFTQPPCFQGKGFNGNCAHYERCRDLSLACKDLNDYLSQVSTKETLKTNAREDDWRRLPTADRFDRLYPDN